MAIPGICQLFGKSIIKQNHPNDLRQQPAKPRPVPPGFDATNPIRPKAKAPSQMDLFSKTQTSGPGHHPPATTPQPSGNAPQSILREPGSPYPNRGPIRFNNTVISRLVAYSPEDGEHVAITRKLPLAEPKPHPPGLRFRF